VIDISAVDDDDLQLLAEVHRLVSKLTQSCYIHRQAQHR
jgi:hypothetical protein